MASISDRASGRLVLEILRSSLNVDWKDYVALVAYKLDGRPFAVLVAVILSQNTNDKLSIKAYKNLRREIGVKPEEILRAGPEKVEKAIRIAGLARQKSKAIVELARRVMEWGGEEYLLREETSILRAKLLEIPGVGPKTVDVFLSLVRRDPNVFAVDTHAARIAKRWGLVKGNASYDNVSRALREFFGPESGDEAHRLLIALGRTYCKARKPLCGSCPVRELCPSAQPR